MLKLNDLFENYDLAKACLKRYDYSEKHLDKMLSYFRISSNAVYPFYAEDGEKVCYLRLTPIAEKCAQSLDFEIRFLRYLIDNGFHAMKPYPMKDGRFSDIIITQWGSYHVSCFEAVAGETLEEIEGSVSLAFGYGKTLAELHNLSAQCPFAEERISYRDLLAQVKQRLIRFHAPEGILQALEQTSDCLNRLARNPEVFGLIHYDFEPDNVLYDADTGIFGVIDFDDAIRCWYALDVVRAIDAMGDVVESGEKKEAIDAFLAGYRSIKPFSALQEETFPLMRNLVRLQEYSTILYVCSEQPTEEPEWMLQIQEKLRAKMRLIEQELC